MRRIQFLFIIIIHLFSQITFAETYQIIHRSLQLKSPQKRTITVEKVDDQTVYLKVTPIFFSNDAIFEATYQIRRNNSGDRLGNREFWRLPTDSEIQTHNDLASECKVDSENTIFETRLKLQFELNLKSLKNWSKLFCLSQDSEAFAIILPELIFQLKPQIAELINFQTHLRQKYLKFEMSQNWEYLSQSLTIIEKLLIEIRQDLTKEKMIEKSKERDFILSNQVSRFIKNSPMILNSKSTNLLW